MKKILLIIIVGGFFCVNMHHQVQDCSTTDKTRAWLDFNIDSTSIHIDAYFFNGTPDTLLIDYSLHTEKYGSSGSSNTSQSGQFFVPSHQQECLSHVNLNLSGSDSIKSKLDVFCDGKMIAADSIFFSNK